MLKISLMLRLALVLAFFASPLREAVAEAEPGLSDRPFALQFRVLGGPRPFPDSEGALFGGLEALAGGASALVHLTDRLALRTGVDFAGADFDGEFGGGCFYSICSTPLFSSIGSQTFFALRSALETEREGFAVVWETPLLYYPYGDQARRVQPYFGLGPTHSHTSEVITTLLPAGYAAEPIDRIERAERTDTRRTTENGGVIVLGGAWFVTPRIALSGEYGFGVVRTSSRSKWRETLYRIPGSFPERTDVEGKSRSVGWSAQSEPIRLGLTLYL